MRFRGRIVDVGCIQHFTRVVGTISKLAKSCILRITANKLYFILSERIINGGVSIWCELFQSHFFNEFAMDGLSAEHNEIYLELIPDNLMKALKTSQNAKAIKIKLTKKHSPCLTFEVELPSLASSSRHATHDVPVSVIPQRLWEEYAEPEIPEFDVTAYLPPMRVLKNVVDRMKNLGNFVVVSINHQREMKLALENELVTVTTYFKDLDYPAYRNGGDATSVRRPADPKQFIDARIDIRKLSQFLSGQQFNPQHFLCNIVHERLVHFCVIHEDVTLQYFIPVVAL